MSRLKKPTLLIDADILAYRASAATDGRVYFVEYEREGQLITLREKYKKDADKNARLLQDEGYTVTVTINYEPEPLSHAIKIMKDTIKSLETQLAPHVDGIGSMRFFLTRGGSFREKEFPLYKSNREGLRRPEHLEACKDWLEKEKGAEVKRGLFEADDLMAMNQGENTVICSIDKDLLQVPGHHFNWVRNEFRVVTEEEGRRNLYKQMLTGDSTDGISGLKGVGPKTAEKLLKNVKSEWRMYCVVLKEYITRLKADEGESYEDFCRRCALLVRVHARLLYLLRSEDDSWEPPKKEDMHEDSGVHQ